MKSKRTLRRRAATRRDTDAADDLRVIIPSQSADAVERRVTIREELHDARARIVRRRPR